MLSLCMHGFSPGSKLSLSVNISVCVRVYVCVCVVAQSFNGLVTPSKVYPILWLRETQATP